MLLTLNTHENSSCYNQALQQIHKTLRFYVSAELSVNPSMYHLVVSPDTMKTYEVNRDTFDFLLRYPKTSLAIVVISVAISVLWSNTAYTYIAETLLQRVQSFLPEILVKMALFFSYTLFLAIGVFLSKVKNIVVNFIGLFVLGLGLGIVIRLSLFFVGIINPYV